MSALRSNLDASLHAVSTAASPSGARLDTPLLERESRRLNASLERFGADCIGQLTPSRLMQSSSMRAAASVDNLLPRLISEGGGESTPAHSYTSTPKIPLLALGRGKKTLSFDKDV